MAKIVQLPRKLWIGTFEVPLKVVPHDDEALKDDRPEIGDNTFSSGMSVVDDEDLCGIWIASNLTPRKRLEIVLHELIHVIDWVCGISDDDLIIEEDIAEKQGKVWAQLCLENPRFVAWLAYVTERIREDQRAEDGDDEPVPNVITEEVTV